jgi:hypothetical protein
MLPSRAPSSAGLTLSDVEALAAAALATEREIDSLARLLDEVELGPELRLSLTAATDTDDGTGVFADIRTLPYRADRRR